MTTHSDAGHRQLAGLTTVHMPRQRPLERAGLVVSPNAHSHVQIRVPTYRKKDGGFRMTAVAPGYNVFSASVQKVPSFVGLREGEKEGVSTEAYQSHMISFMEVYNKSLCQPRELLVEIAQEYPEEVEHIFIPSCVVLTRCAGCCNDEMLQCTPTSTHNVTMEIKRIKPQRQQNDIFMSFTEHSACECRKPRKDKGKGQKRKRKKNHDQKNGEAQCEPCCDGCSERRKQGFIQDPLTCQCSCRNSNAHCRARYLELNERTCRCDKPRR
ncbi:unnamed protein product [Coregonus sp. 'balchen']|nr:unnamed protein product [Coregonus sp. 'balchen']